MSTRKQRGPRIVHLASQLEDDIRARGLKPGDPYLSTQDAARMLSVSNAAANRALQLLVKRDILHRRQRSGTFLAEPKPSSCVEMDLVHVLVHQSYLKTEGLLTDGVVLGIQGKLPQAEIQINFMPANDDGAYVNRLISETLNSKRVEGYVLLRAPLAVQRIVQASGLPAVIHGSSFPSINSIPRIDRDNYQAGQLAAGRLIRDGFQLLTIISRDYQLPGDNLMFRGVRDTIGAAGLPVDALDVRALPSDAEVVRHETIEILQTDAESGCSRRGFVCRSRPAADGVVEAIRDSGLRLGLDSQVVLLDVYRSSSLQMPPYPHLLMDMEPETIGQHIGQFLLAQARGLKVELGVETISVKLREGV